jgi:hypothetical protein
MGERGGEADRIGAKQGDVDHGARIGGARGGVRNA